MKTDPYANRKTARFVVTRNYVEQFWHDKYDECLVWLQRHVPYSWDHAMKHEGWAIVDREEKNNGISK